MKATLVIGLWLLCFSGCGAAHMMSQPSVRQDRAGEEVSALRSQQMEALYSFDRFLMSNKSSACQPLCDHHTRICALATRICDISKKHPKHQRASLACTAANKTCRDTNQRLPEDCWCR